MPLEERQAGWRPPPELDANLGASPELWMSPQLLPQGVGPRGAEPATGQKRLPGHSRPCPQGPNRHVGVWMLGHRLRTHIYTPSTRFHTRAHACTEPTVLRCKVPYSGVMRPTHWEMMPLKASEGVIAPNRRGHATPCHTMRFTRAASVSDTGRGEEECGRNGEAGCTGQFE